METPKAGNRREELTSSAALTAHSGLAALGKGPCWFIGPLNGRMRHRGGVQGLYNSGIRGVPIRRLTPEEPLAKER